MNKMIIKIDEEKCDGCGLCADACHEGAITIVDGKARLANKNICDGLGDCLPVCPTGAIELVKRPGGPPCMKPSEGRRYQWPLQIRLVPVNAPYFKEADLLIASDCSGYAYGEFNENIRKDRAIVIGCPKLDDCDYSEKLAEIIKANDIKSVTVSRMEVPCCGGIEQAAKDAIAKAGSKAPLTIITLSADGSIVCPEKDD